MAKFPASRIFKLQNELNILSGRDSLRCGGGSDEACKAEFCYDYFLAIYSEGDELMNNFVWKHWSAESKAGGRWVLLDAQNLLVELADIWLFVTSLCQCAGVTRQEYMAGCLALPKKAAAMAPGSQIVGLAMNLVFAAKQTAESRRCRKDKALKTLKMLVALTAKCGLDAGGISALYLQKAEIHAGRMRRGRKQVGDLLAEEENRRISLV